MMIGRGGRGLCVIVYSLQSWTVYGIEIREKSRNIHA